MVLLTTKDDFDIVVNYENDNVEKVVENSSDIIRISGIDVYEILKNKSLDEVQKKFNSFFTDAKLKKASLKYCEDHFFDSNMWKVCIADGYQILLSDFFEQEFNIELYNIEQHLTRYLNLDLDFEKRYIYFSTKSKKFIPAEEYLLSQETLYCYKENDWPHWSKIKLKKIQEIDISDNNVSLDVFDGTKYRLPNMVFGHAAVYKILNCDNSYLLKDWNDYRSFYVGTVLTKEKLLEKIIKMFSNTQFENSLEYKLELIEQL